MSLHTFDTPDAIAINEARMRHLEGLGLELAGKRVLDVGCGVGHLSARLHRLGASVTCIDARRENLTSLVERYPQLRDVRILDAEDLPEFHGGVDVVFCYGLLYHLEAPFRALRRMAAEARELLLLETIVADHPAPVVVLAEEPQLANQALQGIASRPTPAWVARALSLLGLRVYAPAAAPDHPDFRWTPRGDLASERDGHPIRAVFVGSRLELANDRLQLIARPA